MFALIYSNKISLHMHMLKRAIGELSRQHIFSRPLPARANSLFTWNSQASLCSHAHTTAHDPWANPQKKIRSAREYCIGWAGCLATRGRVCCCVQILALACLLQLAKDGSLAHHIASWQTGLAVADAAYLSRLEPNALTQSAP